MLVLDRKNGESIIIDGDIVVKVIKITPTVVTLGLEAPGREILREELVGQPNMKGRHHGPRHRGAKP